MKPYRLGPGETFLEQQVKHMEHYANHPIMGPAHRTYKKWLAAINSEETKRVLFDAIQAEQFAPLTDFPEDWHDHIREPFPAFYMEFTAPVSIGDRFAVDEGDYLRAILYGPGVPITVATSNPIAVGGAGTEKRAANHLVMFFENPTTGMYTDRHCRVDIKKGLAYVSRYMAERTWEWRFAPTTEGWARKIAEDNTYGIGKAVIEQAVKDGTLTAEQGARFMSETIPSSAHDASTGLGHVPDNEEVHFAAGDFIHTGRAVGWWERQSIAAVSLLQWCLAYMMAKSIVVEVRDVSRQQRRWLQRHGKELPKPWHVVMVDPKYVRTIEANPNVQFHHSYRYDVMGHLRVGRHRVGTKKGDGTYEHRQTLEWVPPHQRGLANDLYIPATRAVQAGRKVPPELKGEAAV